VSETARLAEVKRLAETWQFDAAEFDRRYNALVKEGRDRRQYGGFASVHVADTALQTVYAAGSYRRHAEQNRIMALAALDLLDAAAMMLGEIDLEEVKFRQRRRAEYLEAWTS
jgi:hypothetical protein